MEWNPRAVFEKLFGDSGSTERSAREARLLQHKSILDSVTEKLASLKKELGPEDQVKVDEYAEAIRDVERRILAGVPLFYGAEGFERSLLLAFTEQNTRAEIDSLVDALREVGR